MMEIIKQEKNQVEFDLEISKSLIKKDLGYRVLLENSQNKSNPEFWDFKSFENAQEKYDSIEFIKN